MTREQAILLDGLTMMGRIFWGPSVETCTEMVEATYLQGLEALAEVINDTRTDDVQQLASIIGSFPGGDSLYEYLEEGYVRLFVSAREGVVAPLYESCYEFEGAPLMGRAATEMKERFEAKGLSVADTIQEPPDHLSIELEYLYFLLDKGWGEKDDALVAEAAEFTSDILLPWVSELSEKVASEEECRYYPLMAGVLMQILTAIATTNKKAPPS